MKTKQQQQDIRDMEDNKLTKLKRNKITYHYRRSDINKQ
jgi:hypothetical protein